MVLGWAGGRGYSRNEKEPDQPDKQDLSPPHYLRNVTGLASVCTEERGRESEFTGKMPFVARHILYVTGCIHVCYRPSLRSGMSTHNSSLSVVACRGINLMQLLFVFL